MIPDDVKSLCDTLEWLLVPWGHKHTGKVVRSTYDRPAGGLVWSNKQPEFLPGHEAELRLVTWPDGRVAYTTGGDMSWVLDARGNTAKRLCMRIALNGFAVQEIGSFGVLVTQRAGGSDGR